MLNAAEAAIEESAEDEKERTANRARLYAPPKGASRSSGQRTLPTGAGMNRNQVQNLMAQAAAQDAQAGRG